MKTKWWMLFLLWTSYLTSNAQIKTLENRLFGCVGASFKFYTQTPLGSYSWDIGGLSFPNIDSPVQIFNNPGVYTIKVGSYTESITIYPTPTVSIACDSPRQGCIPYTVQLRNTTSIPPGLVATETKWLYEDGGFSLGDTTSKTFTIKNQFQSYVHLYLKFFPPGCDVDAQFNRYLLMDSVPIARIQYSPDYICRLPKTVVFTNTTGESVNSNMSYQWKWTLPTIDSSTSKQLASKTYTNVNGFDRVILTASSQMGCMDRDTALVTIDTMKFDYYVKDTTCVRTAGELVILKSSDTATYQFDFIQNSIFYIQSANKDSWKYNLTNRNVPTGFYPFTIKKTDPRDTSCSKTLTKQILVINETPQLINLPSPKCNVLKVDTLKIEGASAFVNGFKVTSTYGDAIPYTLSNKVYFKIPPDTTIYDTLNFHIRDSFYRKGNLTKSNTVVFYFKGTNCIVTRDFTSIDTALFYSFIHASKTKGCRGMSASFIAQPNERHKLDSVYWYVDNAMVGVAKVKAPFLSDTLEHTFNTPGKFKVYAISVSKNGCRDTAAIWMTVGDSLIPQVTISADTICINDTVVISKIGTTHFDRLYFSGEDYRAYNCPSDTSIVWRKFNRTGTHYIRTYALKDGCATMGLDSIMVKGPKFFLDYDFKCTRRDSIQFFLSDKMETAGMSFRWNFGDGTPSVTQSHDTLWHKFTTDSADHWVSVKALNPDPTGCQYEDSTKIHIRHVKALFTDTLFCKSSNNDYQTFPYLLDPTKSKQADYAVCNYQYTWLFEWKGKQYPPISYGGPNYFDLPYDSLNTTLVARDINGCTDTMTRYVEATTNSLKFTVNKDYLNAEYYCKPGENVRFRSYSTSKYNVKHYNWVITKYNGSTASEDTVAKYLNSTTSDSIKIDTTAPNSYYIYIDPKVQQSDTFYITHSVTNYINCASDSTIRKMIVFFNDTSKIIGPDTICETGLGQYKLSTNNASQLQYQWYKNNILLPNDTNYFLKDSLIGIQNTYTPYQLKIVSRHRLSGCTDSVLRTVIISPRPSLRIDNTFDTAKQKCPFSFGGTTYTTIQYSDTNNTNLSYRWTLNGFEYTVNPATMPLLKGINSIKGYFKTYGCVDSIENLDTVVDPIATLILDKTNICRGDSILFTYSGMADIDSIEMSFGDGYDFKKGNLFGTTTFSTRHNYLKSNITTTNLGIYYTYYAPNNRCQRSFNTPISVKDVESKFILNNGGDTSFCFGPVPLKNIITNGDSFVWNFGDGIKDTSRYRTAYTYASPGTYPITLHSYRLPERCFEIYQKTVILQPYPKLEVKIDTICYETPLKIEYNVDIPNTKITIDPDSLKGNPFLQSPILTKIKENRTIRLIATTSAGCKDTVDTEAVILKPFDVLSFDTIVVAGALVKLPVLFNSNWKYTWIPKLINPSCLQCSDPELQFIVPTKYKLILADIHGCHTDTADFFIDIYPDILVKVPTAFTPNGDGINDIIYARGFGIKKLLNFKIYNRLGQLLFISYDEHIGWDGYYKDILQNSDPYYYTYEAESYIPGKIVRGEGNFMLLR